MVVTAEEHGELHRHKGTEQGDERSEGNRPLDRREPAKLFRLQPFRGPPGGEGEPERAGEDDQEDRDAERDGAPRRKRNAAAELGEGGVGGEEQHRERNDEESAEDHAADGGRQPSVAARRDRREVAQPCERRRRGREPPTRNGKRSGHPRRRQVDRDDPAGVAHGRERRQRQGQASEDDRANIRPTSSGGSRRDQHGDEEDADPGRSSRNHGGGAERGRQGEPPHRGSSTTMRQPCGRTGSARIVPPWSSTIQRAIARPRPLPPSVALRAWSER
jgi:hypothetical protein